MSLFKLREKKKKKHNVKVRSNFKGQHHVWKGSIKVLTLVEGSSELQRSFRIDASDWMNCDS